MRVATVCFCGGAKPSRGDATVLEDVAAWRIPGRWTTGSSTAMP